MYHIKIFRWNYCQLFHRIQPFTFSVISEIYPLTCYLEFSIHQSTHALLLLEETRKVIPDISFHTATPSLATFLPVDPMALPSQMGYPGLSLQQVQVHCNNPLSPTCPEDLEHDHPEGISQMPRAPELNLSDTNESNEASPNWWYSGLLTVSLLYLCNYCTILYFI